MRLPRLHASQRRVAAEAKRFNILACGRRWGKTTLGVDRAVGPALAGFPVGWFSPTYKMLLEAWREIARVLQPVTKRSNVSERRIELVTGGVVEMWSLTDPDAARGRRYKRVVIDEASVVRYLREAWQEVLRPALADYRGDAWFLGTPKGRNYFAELYDLGQDPLQEEYASWQLPTSANPFIPPTEVAAMQAGLPERIYQQEILAQFLADAGGVFRRVLEAATAVEQERAQAGRRYVAGVDWGKLEDFTAIIVLDDQGRMAALERFNRVDYAQQLGRLTALVERFWPSPIVAERNSMGEPLIEQLQRQGLPVQPFTTTAASKQMAIDALALALERGSISLLPDPVLIAELQAYEATRLSSGMLRYGAPPGMHDDCVMALALAWQALDVPQVSIVYDDSLRERVAIGY